MCSISVVKSASYTGVCMYTEYKNIIRPVLLYGSETWALRKAEQDLLERTEMGIYDGNKED